MDHRAGQKRAIEFLYPPIEPFDQQRLDVGNGHSVYFEQSGKPDGTPVFVFHGGPGGGCSPAMRRYFDPAIYRVILIDQRGCGRSRPHAQVEHNTTWDLVADFEAIRGKLDIARFIAFGGSWGATLALTYAISHPSRVSHLVLRGVFLMTRAELKWFYGGGAAQFFPDLWQKFISQIPPEEHDDLIGAYHRRLFGETTTQELQLCQAWTSWENALASVNAANNNALVPSEYARAFTRIENHYFQNLGFLPQDHWIEANRASITHISCDIVQGRMDMVCPPHSAYRLAQGWDKANLQMIAASGHALSEPGISAALVGVMDRLGQRVPL